MRCTALILLAGLSACAQQPRPTAQAYVPAYAPPPAPPMTARARRVAEVVEVIRTEPRLGMTALRDAAEEEVDSQPSPPRRGPQREAAVRSEMQRLLAEAKQKVATTQRQADTAERQRRNQEYCRDLSWDVSGYDSFDRVMARNILGGSATQNQLYGSCMGGFARTENYLRP